MSAQHIPGPLKAVVSSDERNIIQTLECGHTINNGAPLGRWAHKPAQKRRCYFCAITKAKGGAA